MHSDKKILAESMNLIDADELIKWIDSEISELTKQLRSERDVSKKYTLSAWINLFNDFKKKTITMSYPTINIQQ